MSIYYLWIEANKTRFVFNIYIVFFCINITRIMIVILYTDSTECKHKNLLETAPLIMKDFPELIHTECWKYSTE